jgi:hypothetical protein
MMKHAAMKTTPRFYEKADRSRWAALSACPLDQPRLAEENVFSMKTVGGVAAAGRPGA